MKPSSFAAVSALSLALVLSANLRADDPSSPPAPPPAPPSATTPPDGGEAPPQHHRHGPRGYSLADLTEKLGLTADQQKTVGSIISTGETQSKQVFSDDTLSRDDKRAKLMEIRKTEHDQIRAALTPDQQKQFDALKPHGERPPPPQQN